MADNTRPARDDAQHPLRTELARAGRSTTAASPRGRAFAESMVGATLGRLLGKLGERFLDQHDWFDFS